MIYQCKMFLQGESWREVVYRCVVEHLSAEGSTTNRTMKIDNWSWRRRVWVVVGPDCDQVPLDRPGLLVGGGGYRHICVDLKTRKVVQEYAFQ